MEHRTVKEWIALQNERKADAKIHEAAARNTLRGTLRLRLVLAAPRIIMNSLIGLMPDPAQSKATGGTSSPAFSGRTLTFRTAPLVL